MPKVPELFNKKAYVTYTEILPAISRNYGVTIQRLLQDPKKFGERLEKDLRRMKEIEEFKDMDIEDIEPNNDYEEIKDIKEGE